MRNVPRTKTPAPRDQAPTTRRRLLSVAEHGADERKTTKLAASTAESRHQSRRRGGQAPPRRAPRLGALLWVVLGLAAFGAVLAPAASAQTDVPIGWELTPSGTQPGQSFRLLFITSTTRTSTTSDIAQYNTFVQRRAEVGHMALRRYASIFRVLGCTDATSAVANTSTSYTASAPGVPVYWLNGAKVADDYADIYDGAWDEERQVRSEYGTYLRNAVGYTNHVPMTGCIDDGSAATADTQSRALGGAPCACRESTRPERT